MWSAMTGYPWVKELSGQLEEGEEGTPHIQGMIRTEYGRWFNKLRAALPRAHIEPAKNPVALANYVQKSETRVGSIPTARVATQATLQERLYVLYYMKQAETEDGLMTNTGDHIRENAVTIRNKADQMIDEAVRSLITDGYFGIEFVMSNNQVRGAFRRYLPEILLRTHQTFSALNNEQFDAEN